MKKSLVALMFMIAASVAMSAEPPIAIAATTHKDSFFDYDAKKLSDELALYREVPRADSTT